MAEHPKQTTIKQHTVLLFYLRGFADDKQSFYSSNKRYKKAKVASVGQSAQSLCFKPRRAATTERWTIAANGSHADAGLTIQCHLDLLDLLLFQNLTHLEE